MGSHILLLIHKKSKTKDKERQLNDEDGDIVTNDSVTVNILNKFLSLVFAGEVIHNLPNPKQFFTGSLDERVLDLLISPEVILKSLVISN